MDGAVTRRFELVEDGSSKFWEIDQEGASFTVRYGRIGSAGQTQKKDFPGEPQARAAAAKLVAEKTGKGYVEVAAGKAPAEAPAEAKPAAEEPAEAKKPAGAKAAAEVPAEAKKAAGAKASAEVPAKAEKPVKAEKPAKAEKKEIPPITVGTKSLGARALVNAAERFAAATTPEAWRDAASKITYSDYDLTKVQAHLLEHGLFTPTHRIHMRACRSALAVAAPEIALSVLAGLAEPLVETLRTEMPIVTLYVPVLARLHGLAPEAFRAAALPPTLARVAWLIRALAGEALDAEQGAGAVTAVAELLPYGEDSIQVVDSEGNQKPVDPEVLRAALARIGGPRWIRTFPKPESLPTAVALPALADEPLEEVGRVLCLFNKPILDVRTEPPARFFEVAEALPDQKASFMRAAGIRKAAHPDEIPAGGEDLLRPMDVHDDPGFAKLGTARLDAWAERWLARFPAALTVTDPVDEAYSIGAGLHRLALLGIPFSEPLQRRLIGLPRPYEHAPDKLDIGDYFQRTRSLRPEGARALLPLFARMARDHEAHPEQAQGLRLAVAAAVRAFPDKAQIPEDIDALLSLGDAMDYDTRRAVREAVLSLPIARGERVIARSAHMLEDPFEELTYAREGASEAAMRRHAQLIAAGREDEGMWQNVRGLAALGPTFGPVLAQVLAGETLSDSFFARIGHALHPEALAHLREAVGKNVLDLPREMAKLTAEIGGGRAAVYIMSSGSVGAGLSRIGGLPAGFEPGDVPRHRGRKLVHAFTVDLKAVPELAARHPGARTLSVWIQGYSEDPVRAQALIPRTDAQIAAAPGAGGAPLGLLRLEVPAAVFSADPPERAAYARQLLYRKAGFLLGGPIWLQSGRPGLDPKFVAQYDERLAPGANFGDVGICYSFTDRAEWQCH